MVSTLCLASENGGGHRNAWTKGVKVLPGVWLARSVCAKLLLIPAITVLLGILVPGMLGYALLQQNAAQQTREKAWQALQTLEAARKSIETVHADKGSPDAFTASVLAEMARRDGTVSIGASTRYRYISSSQPNSDPFCAEEDRLISTFSADPDLQRMEEEIQRPDGRYLMVAVPIRKSAAKIRTGTQPLSAHGTRAVLGASVIYASLEPARAQARRIFWEIASLVGLLTIFATGFLVWRTWKLISRPVLRLLETSQAIRRGDWKARFEERSSDELSALAASFQETTYWLRERLAHEEKLRALFQQFIPASVAARALGKDAEKALAGTRHSVSVMIINIRNFKLLMEHLPPDQTVVTLNEFFSLVNKVIVDHKGVVSKYLGDTVMAIFGMPLANEDHALHAVRAALAIPPALQELYIRLDEEYGWQLGVGIGISTGEPIVGHFGSSIHMEYTVLGDVVVDAHRLEKISKVVPEEDTILIDEPTYRRVMSDVHVFDMGERSVDGGSVHAFAVQGLRSEARSVLAA